VKPQEIKINMVGGKEAIMNKEYSRHLLGEKVEEGMFSGAKSEEEKLAKAILKIVKEKSKKMGLDYKKVLGAMG